MLPTVTHRYELPDDGRFTLKPKHFEILLVMEWLVREARYRWNIHTVAPTNSRDLRHGRPSKSGMCTRHVRDT